MNAWEAKQIADNVNLDKELIEVSWSDETLNN